MAGDHISIVLDPILTLDERERQIPQLCNGASHEPVDHHQREIHFYPAELMQNGSVEQHEQPPEQDAAGIALQ